MSPKFHSIFFDMQNYLQLRGEYKIFSGKEEKRTRDNS